MAQGMSNSAACREVGVNRKTGHRWTYGRTVKNETGPDYVYAPIAEKKEAISDRFLSEDERVQTADLLRAGHSLRSIARRLGRGPSTISRELHRNSNPTQAPTSLSGPSGMRWPDGPGPKKESSAAIPNRRSLSSSTWAIGGARNRSAARCRPLSPDSRNGICPRPRCFTPVAG
ncbi:helix-turn-helix domain-containing protein [Streptomyces vinaceus]